MKCQRCESTRLAGVNAKCSDLCQFIDHQGGRDRDYYVPEQVGVGGGDYVEFDYCLDCGQIQGQFPIPQEKVDAFFPEQ